MNASKFYKYSPYIIVPLMWYYVGTHDREYVKKTMYYKGLKLSQRFKKYKQWDGIIEPFIVKQASIIFIGGNAFIKGMTSDNENKEEINKSIDFYKENIKKELDDLTKE